MMMIFLQILISIIVAEENAVENGISRIVAAESQERRELFVCWDCIEDCVTDPEGCAEDGVEALEDGAKVVVEYYDDLADYVEEGAEVVGDVVVEGWEEVGEISDAALDAIAKVANDGLDAIKDLPLDDIVAVLKTAWEGLECGPKDCMTDFTVSGCMPSNEGCEITYGKDCLKYSGTIGTYQEISGSVSRKEDTKGYDGYIEGEAGVTMYGTATATVDTSAEIKLKLDGEPRIGVVFRPPSIDLTAEVGFDFEAGVEIQANEKRIALSSPKNIFTRAFMAGPIPVLVGIKATPIAILSAQGTVDTAGSASYKLNGNFGFDQIMQVDFSLLDFTTSHNLNTITMPMPVINDEGFNFDMEINSELQLDVKLGVEFGFHFYNAVEINLVPMITTKLIAHADVAVSGNNDGATGSASADLTICLGGEFDSYFDYAVKKRRELEEVNLLVSIEESCGELSEFLLGENCVFNDLMTEVFDICGVATDILKELGFPATIEIPSLSDFDIPSLRTPDACYDTSIGTSTEVTWNEVSSEGELNEVYSTGRYGIHNGHLGSSVSIQGRCAGKRRDAFLCGRPRNYIKWQVDFGRSNFAVKSEFKASRVAGTALVFVLWSGNTMYNIGLDGRNRVLFYEGGNWGGATLLDATTLDPSRYQTISIRRSNNHLFVRFDGYSWRPIPFTADVTAVGWRPWRNTIRVKTLQHFNPQVKYGIVNGELDSSVSVTGRRCRGRVGSKFVCGGTRRYIKWNVDIGNSDFVIESVFRASRVSATALVFVLWSGSTMYNVGLDGRGRVYFYEGGNWGRATVLERTHLDPSRFQKIELRRTGDSLLVTFDGHEWGALPLSASITAIGWRPWRNTIHIKNLLHY